MDKKTLLKKEQNFLKKNPYGLKLFKKDGTLSTNAKNAINGSVQRGNKIYYFTWTGSGRHINAKDNSAYIERALKLGGYKFKKGNDSPRGGKEGNYLSLSNAALKFLNSLT